MGSNSHDQIIKQLCKDTLLPLGVFQKGTSRIYIDDNGYFFTVLEFQSSAHAQGTYLNIALHFCGTKGIIFPSIFLLIAGSRISLNIRMMNSLLVELQNTSKKLPSR